jgi:hypothetical protein
MNLRETFLEFSAEMGGFSISELRSAGIAVGSKPEDDYCALISSIVGDSTVGELLDAYAAIEETDPGLRERALRQRILGHQKLGDIARSIIKLWWIAIWEPLPNSWMDAYGVTEENYGRAASKTGYLRALLFTVVGAHPPAANPPGYASYVGPPEFPPLPVFRNGYGKAKD